MNMKGAEKMRETGKESPEREHRITERVHQAKESSQEKAESKNGEGSHRRKQGDSIEQSCLKTDGQQEPMERDGSKGKPSGGK